MFAVSNGGVDWSGIAQVITAVGVVLTTIFSFLTKLQGKKNERIATRAEQASTKAHKVGEETLKISKDTQKKVNGNLEKAVALAKEEARKNSPPRVLIIDDDKNDILLAMEPLKKFDCVIFTATTPEEAETILTQNVGSGRG